MSDILLFHTDDGGEIDVQNGRFVLDDSPSTAVYLSLFGGNERDDGSAATSSLQWWGNLLEDDRALHYRSETQHHLRILPATPASLRRIEDAATRDLAWMVDALDAEVIVNASMPALNRIALNVAMTINGETTELNFEQPWRTE